MLLLLFTGWFRTECLIPYFDSELSPR